MSGQTGAGRKQCKVAVFLFARKLPNPDPNAPAVVATGSAGFVFSWLRRRSGSLIAPIALHWSLNGLGALAAALVFHLST